MKKKEFFRFLVSGGSAVATDLMVYFLLKDFFSPHLSKAVSFISGTTIAYVLNKYWTFEMKERSFKEAIRFFLLYTFSLCVNVLVNKMTLTIFPDLYLFAFFTSTGASTILNFIGQKWWVFKEMNA